MVSAYTWPHTKRVDTSARLASQKALLKRL